MVDSAKFKIWDKMAKSFHVTSSRSSAHVKKYQMIADLIIASKSKTVLDLGCGSGILEKEIITRGYKGSIYAYDGSASMLAIAKEIAQSRNVHFKLSDIDNHKSFGSKYDTIVSINLIFFLKHKQDFFNKVASHLKDGRSLFILVSPKPAAESSNWEFVREHLSGASPFGKLLILINEVVNIPRYVELAIRQKRLDSMAKHGEISADTPMEIEEMAKLAGLNIFEKREIHARQNWIYLMRLKK